MGGMFYWTLDIFASCRVGYIKDDGVVEMHLWKIMVRYLKSWFLFDLFIVSTEWLTTGMAMFGHRDTSVLDGLALTRVGKMVRVTRIIRAVRLLRIPKLVKIIRRYNIW